MATTDGLPPDPLALLRSSIADSSLPIPTSTSDAATAEQSLAAAGYLVFNQNGQHISIPLSQETRFISVASGNKPIDLRSVFFCWQSRDKSTGEYIAATQELNGELSGLGKQETVTNLVFVEKLDLVNWLSGESGEEESEFIKSLDDNLQTKTEARDAAATAAGGEDVEMRDAGISDAAARKREEERLREIYALERKMGDRNTVLRGVKVQDFSAIRKYAAAFHVKNAKGAPAPSAPLSANPALRPSVKSSSGRRAEPIILLSPSASSLIRMPNVKSFLQDGQYQAPETASSTAPNILHLTRLLPSIDAQKPMRFILVDSPDQFRPDYWNRVVAVFTTGQAWQFKNYKWQAPADLFSHVQGVYVGWQGEVLPDTVKGWGRGVLSVGLDKGNARWRDREVVEEVWSGIESRMRAMGWSRDGPSTATVTDADRADLIAYVRSCDPRLINPSRRTPEQDTVYNNALSDIERQLREERLVPARATPTQHSTAMVTDADRANLRAYVRSRAQRVKNPSRRTPERETVFNNADNVERQLQEDGHKIWGWVIYRCTYANDEEWAEFMARLRYWNEYTLRSSNALDMLPSVDYQVFENSDIFDNAHPSTVREHFAQWAVTAPRQEQGEGAYPMRSQRYNYCLHVDQEALLSVIGGSPPSVLTFMGPGYVNLVCKTIIGGMRPEHTFGRAEQEHCFMRINYQSLMLYWYDQLRREGSWFNEYRVPPEVARI